MVAATSVPEEPSSREPESEAPAEAPPLDAQGPAPPAGPPSLPAADASREASPGKAQLDRVRLSSRVILHIYAQGELPPGAVAPPGFCQAGIGEALGISQGGLAAVLRRLEATGVFTTERGHVRGRDRRLKIYRLSARGLALARELRARGDRGRRGH